MVLRSNRSFHDFESQFNQKLECFWSQSKSNFQNICGYFQNISSNILDNLTYMFDRKYANAWQRREPEQDGDGDGDGHQYQHQHQVWERNVHDHFRHTKMINQLKQKQLDKEWETINV